MRNMPTEPAPRVLEDFEGAWGITRHITHADGTTAEFTGTAQWTHDPGGLIYREIGKLQMAQGPAFQAERQYLWRPGLNVYFDDGRFFHKAPERGGDATHWCDPDTYHVTYDFSRWPDFTATWKVSGPKKSYTMRSQYKRC
ncbi:DUF6314 family protein [uncultured Roseobacter sp.]|uniref:DUF6314 family protein n=1 Tax=uncultured Roseobacter sp. TaxID=114847 RepID=UPI00261525A3|nr:DUF6314 family protein [uncultured Roseobacter sp.]